MPAPNEYTQEFGQYVENGLISLGVADGGGLIAVEVDGEMIDTITQG